MKIVLFLFLYLEKCWSGKMAYQHFGFEKFWVRKIGSKNILIPKKKLVQKTFGLKKFGGNKIFVEKILAPQKVGPKNLVKFGQAQRIYCWYVQMSPGQMLTGQMSP